MEKSSTKTLLCEICKAEVIRLAPYQRYCSYCAPIARKATKMRHYYKTKDYPEKKELVKRKSTRAKELFVQNGLIIAEQEQWASVLWKDDLAIPNFNQSYTFSVPFDWSLSKNQRVNRSWGGKYYLTKTVTEAQDSISNLLKGSGLQWTQNKLYMDILVEKPNMRGDAINFIDGLADAIKIGTGVDDRWFSLGRVDWTINKIAPKIWVTIKQDTTTPHQACSHCGRILPFDNFTKNRCAKNGIGRACRDCKKTRKPHI